MLSWVFIGSRTLLGTWIISKPHYFHLMWLEWWFILKGQIFSFYGFRNIYQS